MTSVSSTPKPLAELDGISLHETPPPAYLEWLATSRAFFDSPAWGGVLQSGLDAQRFYLWDSNFELGHALTCFHKGPFHIGYLGFPICAAASTPEPPYVLDRMISLIRAMPHTPQLLRLPLSPLGNRTSSALGKTHWATESSIPDLRTWRSDGTSARRRYLSVARKRCGDMVVTVNASGAALFKLYAAAVTRHHGVKRYTIGYFDALKEMSPDSPVRIYCLNDCNGLAGMMVTGDHGDTCYYLHGGTRPDALGLGTADLLMAHAITGARERNLAKFNFLTSPQEQTGLIRFKEKWGGVSLPAQTNDVPINILGRVLARLMA